VKKSRVTAKDRPQVFYSVKNSGADYKKCQPTRGNLMAKEDKVFDDGEGKIRRLTGNT